MSIIWNHLIQCQNEIIKIFDENATEYQEAGLEKFNDPDGNWINRTWHSDSVRRAHIDLVDARDTKGIWMMHVTVMPVPTHDAPIFGFDVIAGTNKMTGAFLDFSASSNLDHPMMQGYAESVVESIPSKKRELPEWARKICRCFLLKKFEKKLSLILWKNSKVNLKKIKKFAKEP